MRRIALHFVLPIALLAAPVMRAQLVAAGAAGAVAVAPHLVAAAPAILTGTLSAGSAHVGQAVLAKLASGSVLSNGAKLPAGTQLLGKVTQVVPFRKGGGSSSLGMMFDRFKLPNGQEGSLASSVVRSIRGGRNNGDADAQADANADVQARADADAQARANARANANANGSASGGLLGSVVGGVGNTVGGVVNGVGNTVGDVATGTTQLVGGLAGIVVNSTGTLVAQGRNVTVPAGTQISVAASANASAAQ